MSVDTTKSRSKRLKRAWMAWLLDVRIRRGCLFVTLTFAGDGKNAKNEIRRFMDRLKKAYGIKKYFWWCELQKRGVVHYHVVIPDVRYIPKQFVASIWGNGFVDLVWISKLSDIYRYVMKYVHKLKKSYQQDYKRFAKLYWGFRVFGSNRLRSFNAKLMRLPAWLVGIAQKMKEIPVRLSSCWEFSSFYVFSPWRVVRVVYKIGGGWIVQLVWVGIRWRQKLLVLTS